MTIYLIIECYYRDNDYSYGYDLEEDPSWDEGYFTDESEAQKQADRLTMQAYERHEEFVRTERKTHQNKVEAYQKCVERNDFLKANGFSPVSITSPRPSSDLYKPVSFEEWLKSSGATHYKVAPLEKATSET